MELHHKLRRDPSWHPNACNICGQLGHQAANCTNGTINWRQIYGDDAFVLKEPLYWSDIRARIESKKVDIDDLKRRAEEFAKSKSQSAGVDYEAVKQTAQASLDAKPEAVAAAQNGAAAQPAAAAAAPAADEAPLPAGWATAKDTEGRTYFWHKKTQKVQWDRPTEETPADA